MASPDKISSTGQQHVQMYRKLLLRRHLLRWSLPGAAYVPFIGDADIAVEVYADRKIYGADLDKERVKTASGRLPNADTRVAACDSWPSQGLPDTIAVADFDAYAAPSPGSRAMWHQHNNYAARLILLFPDGHRQ